MTPFPFNSTDLPSDKDTLQLMVLALLEERDQQKRRAQEQARCVDEQRKQAAALQVELLRVKLELDRYKKWYYGPRADWLQSDQDVAQMLLNSPRNWTASLFPQKIWLLRLSLPKSCVG